MEYVLEVASEDYVRAARAKGLPERRVIWRHALKTALTPMVTLLGVMFPALLGGALQLFHDCVFYFMFRDVKPPEEQRSRLAVATEP